MSFKLQDPKWPGSSYLLEELARAAETAASGAGLFAFVTKGGANLLLRDPAVVQLLARGSYRLTVGLDCVTNQAALQRLVELRELMPNLAIDAFLTERPGGIFHPKACYFEKADGATWIVGSGNLTPNGLRGNVEGFSVENVSLAEHSGRLAVLDNWRDSQAGRFREITDQEVLDRVAFNEGRDPNEGGVEGVRQELLVEEASGKVSVGPSLDESSVVLVAEIPRASNRWNQANFDLDNFTNFFGATLGATQRILLTHIAADGTAGEEEIRPSVAVASQNYRFELEAAAGLDYPTGALRPIGLFVRAGTRTFQYYLAMPGSFGYDQLHGFLLHVVPNPGRQVRRARTNVHELREIWPHCPILGR